MEMNVIAGMFSVSTRFLEGFDREFDGMRRIGQALDRNSATLNDPLLGRHEFARHANSLDGANDIVFVQMKNGEALVLRATAYDTPEISVAQPRDL